MGGPNHDVSPALIRKIAGQFADATRKRLARAKGTQEGGYGGVIIMWGIGYNQHIHGQHNVISIVNLLTLTGNLAKPGCGPFSMTGQPNAMGERFTGGLTGRLPFNMPLNDAPHRLKMAKAWGVPEQNLINAMNSKNPGYAVGMMERALKDEVKAFFFVYATHIDLPDQYNLVRPAISKTFNVVQEIYRHAPNNLYADVIFPAATWGEVEGVYISSERRINLCQKAAEPPPGCRPDMDMVIDKAKGIGELLGLDMEKSLPYQRKDDGYYDAEEVFRDVVKASAGTDTDLTGILEVEKLDESSPYEQLEELRGIQWPAPTYEIAQNGGTKRRYMLQEGDWESKPYGYFRTKDGKVHMKLVHQDYSEREKLTKELMRFGAEKGLYTIDHMDLIKEVRDKGLTPDLPDEEHRGKAWQDVPEDKFAYWFGPPAGAGDVRGDAPRRRQGSGRRGRRQASGGDPARILGGPGPGGHEFPGEAGPQQCAAGLHVRALESLGSRQRRSQEKQMAGQRRDQPYLGPGLRPSGLQEERLPDREDLGEGRAGLGLSENDETQNLRQGVGRRRSGGGSPRIRSGRAEPAVAPLSASARRLAGGRLPEPLHQLRPVRRGLPQPLHQVFRPGQRFKLHRYAVHHPAREGLHFMHEVRRGLSDRRDPAGRTGTGRDSRRGQDGPRPGRRKPVPVLPGQVLRRLLPGLPAAGRRHHRRLHGSPM
jgi:hypothetical protein